MVESTPSSDMSKEELLQEIARLQEAAGALQGKEKRYETFFNASTDAIMIMEITPTGPKVLECNKRTLELYGLERKEDFYALEGPWVLSPPTQPDGSSSKEKAMALFESAFEGKPQDYYWQHMRKDGSLVDVEISLSALVLEGRNCLQAIIRDVTDKRRAQAALFTSEKRYRNLFDNTFNAVALHELVVDDNVEPIDYIFLEVNPAFEIVTGLSAIDMIGKKVTDAIPGIKNTHLIETYGRVAQTGEPTSFDMFFEPMQKHFEITAFSPNPNQFATVFSDVTERKKFEEELVLDEERLESLVELYQMKHASEEELLAYAQEEIVRLTKSEVGYIHFVNPDQESLALHSWSRKTMEKCTAEQNQHYAVDRAGIWADCVRLKKPVVYNDYPNAPNKKGVPEGHFPIIRHMSVPVFEKDDIVAVAGVGNKKDPYNEADTRQLTLFMAGLWDIIQRKKDEDKIRISLAEKETLLAEVNHRVKNNMQIISSLFSLQSKAMPEGEARSFIEDMKGRVNSMATVHEVLYSSSNITEVPFDWYLHSLVTSIIGMGREGAIKPVFEMDKLNVDAKRTISLGLMVNEMVTNSMKHAYPDGQKGTISITLRQNNGTISLGIKDDGIGMPEPAEIDGTKSLGVRLIDMLRKQIRAEIVLNRQGGTEYILNFPAVEE